MTKMRIGLHQNRTAFAPGEMISGAVDWQEEHAPRSAQVRLGWFTQGKGSEDAAVVRVVELEAPQPEDLRKFSFPAPAAPYSFSGKLISLIWAVELLLQPGGRWERIEVVIAPEGKEVILPTLAQEDGHKAWRFNGREV